MFRNGPVSSNIVEAGAFWWGDRTEKTPDLQFHFLAGAGVEEGVGSVPGGNGATCNSYHTRPRSRGSRYLAFNKPVDAPLIDPNSFAEPYDLERHIEGIKVTQEVGRIKSFANLWSANIFPARLQDQTGLHRCRTQQRALVLSSGWHLQTGCDDMAVVDLACRVHGLEGLARVRQFHHAASRFVQHQCAHHCHCRKSR